jgi:hypothetical protein
MSNVVKFPYNASRRVHSRKPRRSKNGTPEERAANASAARPDPAPLANVVQLSRAPAVVFMPPTAEETARFQALYEQMGSEDKLHISNLLRDMVNNRRPQ